MRNQKAFIKNKIKNTKMFNWIKQFWVYQHTKKIFRKRPMNIYLTFACNLNCDYCAINKYNLPENKSKSYSITKGEKWIEAINRIGKNVTFTGGEPTLHPDFIKIINNIDKKIFILVDTNFCWSDEFTQRYINEITRPVRFYGSYHPSSGKPERVIKVINKLREHNLIEGVIHIVNPNDDDFFKEAQEKFKQNGWYLLKTENITNSFEGCSMSFRKTVKCSGKEIFIAPNGDRYQCVSKLLRMKDPLENIFNENIKEGKVSCVCPDYGFCSSCDSWFKIKEVKNEFK